MVLGVFVSVILVLYLFVCFIYGFFGSGKMYTIVAFVIKVVEFLKFLNGRIMIVVYINVVVDWVF